MGHDVDLPLLVPGFDVRIQRVAASGDAGVGKEHVHGSVGAFGFGHQRVYVGFVADIAGHRLAADLNGHLACAVAV